MSLVGDRIGKIRLIKTLGEGGMGQVFVGYDEKLERHVAVKVIGGVLRLDPEAKERFIREARVLSKLEHPNICRIYDFIEGEENDFIVLELIKGEDLSGMVKAMKWKERMRVARQVAGVLVEAHKQNIVHRDLKPDNIMMTEDGQVKVLDFGLARSVGDSSVATAPFREQDEAIVVDLGGREIRVQVPHILEGGGFRTEHGVIMGTPMYMSPEQARGEAVTAASDMYSFGLLLQWLFTGEQPYPQGLTGMGLIVRAMRGQTEPVKGIDSSLIALIEALKSVAPENRPIATDVFDRLERIRRKPLRRLRALALAAFFAVLVIGTVLSTLGFLAARHSEREARASEERAIKGEMAAKETVKLFQEFLASADPREKGRDLKVIDLLKAFQSRLDSLQDKALIRADLYYAYSGTYKGLGLYDEAAEFARKSYELRKQELGDEQQDTLASLNSLANALSYQGKSGEAEELFRQCMELQRRVLGDEHRETLLTMNNLALMAENQGHYSDAEKLHRQCLAARTRTLGEDHPETLSSRDNLSIVLYRQGKYADAELAFRECFEARRRLLGDEHPETLGSMNNLGGALFIQEKSAEAEPIFLQCLEIRKRVEGETHPHTLESMNNLACLYERLGKFEDSETLFRQCFETRKQVLGEEHPATLSAMRNLASMLESAGRAAESEAIIRPCIEAQTRVLGETHPNTLKSIGVLVRAWTQQGVNLEQAEGLATRCVTESVRTLGEAHDNSMECMETLAKVLEKQGRLAEAIAWYREAARLGQSSSQEALARLGVEWEGEKDPGPVGM